MPAVTSGVTAPALTLDEDTLALVAADMGWAEYRLPTTARGHVVLELGGRTPTTFEVEVLGFRSATALDVNLVGNLLVWPHDGGAASVLGGPGDYSGVIQVLPGLGQAGYLVEGDFALSFGDVRGVGPTYDPDLLLLPPESGRADLWRVAPSMAVVDSFIGPMTRHAMLLSDSVFVYSTHHTIASFDPTTDEWFHEEFYEESRGAVASPGGRYGAFRVGGSELGPPVFDGRTGQVAVHVDTLFRSYGVDFSPVGDTLYIAGIRRASPKSEMLFAIDLATREIVGGIDLGAREAINIVRDRNGPWLYVMAAVLTQPNSESVVESYAGVPPVMMVIDSRTMEVVGEMATTGFTHCLGWCEGAVTSGDDGVFFVMTGVPARVLSFDGWPAD